MLSSGDRAAPLMEAKRNTVVFEGDVEPSESRNGCFVRTALRPLICTRP